MTGPLEAGVPPLACTDPNMSALVVSLETIEGAHQINLSRRKQNFDQLAIIAVCVLSTANPGLYTYISVKFVVVASLLLIIIRSSYIELTWSRWRLFHKGLQYEFKSKRELGLLSALPNLSLCKALEVSIQ